jgi:phytoene dehydrogenase-like protein
VGFACTEATYGSGAWMVEGGVGQLTGALLQAFRREGGCLLPRTTARRILVEKGRAAGVLTASGERLRAETVVLAGAVPALLGDLCSRPGTLPGRYGQRLALMEATGSYYFACCRAPEGAVQGLRPNMEMIDTTVSAPWPDGTWYLMIPSLVDRTCAPVGTHTVCLSLPLPASPRLDRAGRLRLRKDLFGRVREAFPGLGPGLDFLFDLGPRQFAAISANPRGCAYGWSLLPGQTGLKRLNFKTPLPGLYLAGHWTMPGGGIAAVTASAELCARAVLKENHAAL